MRMHPIGTALLGAVVAASLCGVEAQAQPAPAGRIKAKEGFKVDLLYSVPEDKQGSWVSLCVDPMGRLITSDQYGGLFRVTLPPLGTTEGIKVEPIPVEVGEAQGLLWAFDSLYVVVNAGGKFKSGLYRVTDTNADDMLDKVELLRLIEGGGEHGPHAVVLSPDGKSLYVVAGNATKLPEISSSRVPLFWGEDQALPYLPDGAGFMTTEKAPGGFVCKVSPDGKEFELVSMGFRNAYDIAFNKHGELFTYDSDMEWDMNLPWYRPTRVCNVTSGADFGYRNGSGKWPIYYFDSLPPTVDIGPGSPTGVTFGTGAKFPARYQDALFLCDWSYGKLYAVHLGPKGSSYTGEVEEFVTGTPLPLTDIVINPADGAMYFAVGGRRTHSGLYRVTYQGAGSLAADHTAIDEGARARDARHKLEAFHGKSDSAAVDAAWPHLASPDRFLSYAARVALEWQDPAWWSERALTEKNPDAAANALLALVRASFRDPDHKKDGDPAPNAELGRKIYDRLGMFDWATLTETQKKNVVRLYQVAMNRIGKPEGEVRDKLIARLGALLPSGSPTLNIELTQTLAALGDPTVIPKALDLLAAAPTQEEQIDYARSIRLLTQGWDKANRERYLSWFAKATGYKGGNSFRGFMNRMKQDAIAGLSDEEKTAFKDILEARAEAATAVAAPARPFVKEWTLDELVASAEKRLASDRDFERGRAMFGAAQCSACHRYENTGGALGPDLTGAGGRFSPRDLLESLLLPSKTISDQYGAVQIATSDGQVITGRIMNLNNDTLMISTNMLDPNAITGVDRAKIEEMRPSPISMMPEGLLNTLNEDEVLDLLAYVLSRGDRANAMFKKSAAGAGGQ